MAEFKVVTDNEEAKLLREADLLWIREEHQDWRRFRGQLTSWGWRYSKQWCEHGYTMGVAIE